MRARAAGDRLPSRERRRKSVGMQRLHTRETCSGALRTHPNEGGGKTAPFFDPDFDGKEPGEVMRMMGRAKKWLESRGYVIQLSGEYHETKIRKLKFE